MHGLVIGSPAGNAGWVSCDWNIDYTYCTISTHFNDGKCASLFSMSSGSNQNPIPWTRIKISPCFIESICDFLDNCYKRLSL